MKSFTRTYDEGVYYFLGYQLSKNVSDYTTSEYSKRLADYGYPIPAYLQAPLFKHPPFFPLLIATSFKVFGTRMTTGIDVSLLCGVLMIPLVYLLGKLIFDNLTGLVSAIFVFIDPIQIMSSQKIWMDSTLALLMMLSVFFMALAIKNGKDHAFLWSGFFAGLAVLTKYPGILIILGGFSYALIWQADLFKNKAYRQSLLLPFVMLVPWWIWNLRVYGVSFIFEHEIIHSMKSNYLFLFNGAGCLFFLLVLLLWRNSVIEYVEKAQYGLKRLLQSHIYRYVMKGIMIILFFVMIAGVLGKIINSVNFYHIPSTGFKGHFFAEESFFFYCGRLVEYSWIYLFGFIGFFVIHKENGLISLLKINAATIIIFFMLWGNYQCRYILAASPLLIMLGVFAFKELFIFLRNHKNGVIRILGQFLLAGILCLVLLRTNYININLSFTNDMIYF